MDVALGEIFAGVFSVHHTPLFLQPSLLIGSIPQTSDSLWEELHAAGEVEYDRFWRMPLEEDYGPQIHSSNADLCNVNTILFDLWCLLSDASYALDGWSVGRQLHRCVIPEVVR
jgi:Cytosol aminopeptidase family, catalytic domain